MTSDAFNNLFTFNQTANHPQKDQDYRNACVKDSVSKTISIIGIPKTATTEQVITLRLRLFLSSKAFDNTTKFCVGPPDSRGLCRPGWCANAGNENKKRRAR